MGCNRRGRRVARGRKWGRRAARTPGILAETDELWGRCRFFPLRRNPARLRGLRWDKPVLQVDCSYEGITMAKQQHADAPVVAAAARRAERSAVSSFETARYIERNIPNFEVLTEEALEIIEHNAETRFWKKSV